jgi:hypothetical protein
MKPTIVRDILELLDANMAGLGLPSVSLLPDMLPDTGDGISVVQTSGAKTLKSFINGKRRCQASFGILARTDGTQTGSATLKAIGWLDAIGSLFEGMNRFTLGSGRIVLKGTITGEPTITTRSQDNRITYQLTVGIEYEETT